VSAVDNGSTEKLFIANCLPNCVAIFFIKNKNNFTEILRGVFKRFTAKGLSGGFCRKLLCSKYIKETVDCYCRKLPTVKYIFSTFVVERLNDFIYCKNQNYLN